MTDNSFYVYVHRRATNGEPFYYGKGKGKRAWEPYRNRWHENVVKKHGIIVEILYEGLTNSEANSLEVKLIAEARARNENITNMTPGGEGAGSGKDHYLYGKTQPTKVRNSISTKVKSWHAANPGAVAGKNNPMYGKGYLQAGELNCNYGKPHSEEHKRKIAVGTSLALSDPEVKKRMAEFTKNNNPMNNPEIREKQLAAVRTEEHRRKLSGFSSGENNPMFGRIKEMSPGYGKKWITNGNECRRIWLHETPPLGWEYGKLDKRKGSK